MTEAVKKYVCTMNLRPVKGNTKLILAGTPFDATILDNHTREVFEERGDLKEFCIDVEANDVPDAPKVVAKKSAKEQIAELKADAKEKFDAELEGRSLKDVQASFSEAEAKASNKPTGIFNKIADELEGMNLDELDAIHADICAENELTAPDAFESIEEAVAKLTSES